MESIINMVLVWIIGISLSIMFGLYIRSSIHVLDPTMNYWALRWKQPNRKRSAKIRVAREKGNKFFCSFIPWERFVLCDREEHKISHCTVELYTTKTTSSDDMILDGFHLALYLYYPQDFDSFVDFYVRGGYKFPSGGYFGKSDIDSIKAFTLENVASAVRDAGQDYSFRDLNSKRAEVQRFIMRTLKKKGGLFRRIGLVVHRVELSHPDFPKTYKDVVHDGAIAKEKGEAKVIDAQFEQKARAILYAEDEKHPNEAALDAFRNSKSSVVMSRGSNDLVSSVLGAEAVKEAVK